METIKTVMAAGGELSGDTRKAGVGYVRCNDCLGTGDGDTDNSTGEILACVMCGGDGEVPV